MAAVAAYVVAWMQNGILCECMLGKYACIMMAMRILLSIKSRLLSIKSRLLKTKFKGPDWFGHETPSLALNDGKIF